MTARWKISLAALGVVAMSCGGASGTTTTPGGGTTTGPSQVTTTTAPSTTTEAPATTVVATTTLAADSHPTFGVSWESVWPAPAETAVYRATTGGSSSELPARVEYGVEFRGTTVDRFVVGTPEGGNEGMAVYFDRSEPWVLKVVAVESFYENIAGGPGLTEVFEEPIRFDGTIGVGDTYEVESTISIEFPGGGAPDFLGVSYRMRPVTIAAGVDTPIGTVDEVLQMEASVGGEFMGNGLFEVVLWLHADHFLLRFEGAPAWDLLELIEPWG